MILSFHHNVGDQHYNKLTLVEVIKLNNKPLVTVAYAFKIYNKVTLGYFLNLFYTTLFILFMDKQTELGGGKG